MSHECERCGAETDNGDIWGDRFLFICDRCRDEFLDWLDSDEKPPVRGACDTCGGPVEASFRYCGGGKVDVVLNCPTCEWSGTQEGSH